MTAQKPPAAPAPGPAPAGSGRIFFGWYIVAAGFFIQALGYGTRYSFSVFFPALISEFGWPRDLAATIFSAHLLSYGITAPLAGHLVDRIGPRKAMLTGAVLLALGLFLSSLAGAPWHFYLTFGLLAGVGLCLLGSVSMTMVVRNWFERRRGTAIALIYLGSGMAFAAYPAVAWLLDQAGWRQAYLVEGLVIAVVFIPLIFLVMVAHPSQKGLTRDGLLAGDRQASILAREARRVVDEKWAAVDWTLALAVRTRRFWLVCLTTFCMWGLGHHLLVAHQVAFAMDLGFSRMYAASVLSLNGLMFSLGSLLSVVSDRIGREQTLTIGTALALSGIVCLLLIQDDSRPWMLYYYALSLGFGYGLCVPTVAAAVTDIFQGPRVGLAVGFVWLSFALGGCLGPWLGGWLFEKFHNYQAAFFFALVTYLAGWACLMAAGPAKIRLVSGRVRG